ncbi:hypothetical protein SODALDRAFT_362672 [Sodiomyces alkalinus F11]|uniref:Uncharacterized protein n=1 Tax=Sodiomyces alkalinus (strain CBS 110278 / VKM F-3762 / F11) TaxID=1314773 RepID=A0A3N2PMX4_SODAK|nr:hypothetical protein SODALDRAFT_362672 [Sodiomyces alkalinus F11]ROT35829.1 hypothetical protein SODALDRAFT_362672 [Sodiomyces alkalinus F11]
MVVEFRYRESNPELRGTSIMKARYMLSAQGFVVWCTSHPGEEAALAIYAVSRATAVAGRAKRQGLLASVSMKQAFFRILWLWGCRLEVVDRSRSSKMSPTWGTLGLVASFGETQQTTLQAGAATPEDDTTSHQPPTFPGLVLLDPQLLPAQAQRGTPRPIAWPTTVSAQVNRRGWQSYPTTAGRNVQLGRAPRIPILHIYCVGLRAACLVSGPEPLSLLLVVDTWTSVHPHTDSSSLPLPPLLSLVLYPRTFPFLLIDPPSRIPRGASIEPLFLPSFFRSSIRETTSFRRRPHRDLDSSLSTSGPVKDFPIRPSLPGRNLQLDSSVLTLRAKEEPYRRSEARRTGEGAAKDQRTSSRPRPRDERDIQTGEL